MKNFLPLLILLFCSSLIQAQTIINHKVPPSTSTSAFRAPNGSVDHSYLRASSIITASEMTAIPAGTTIPTFGFSLSSGASIAVSGTLKIYMKNTTDSTNLKGTAWTSIISDMTLVYDGNYTVPTTAGPALVTLTNPFAYSGDGVYVAYEYTSTGPFSSTNAVYESNTAMTDGVKMNNSQTSLPATLSVSSNWRPTFIINYPNPFTNDAGVLNFTSITKTTLLSDTVVIRTRVKNSGSNPVSNLLVNLNITGANNYNSSFTLGNLPAGQDSLIVFKFKPQNIGTSNILIHVPGDQYSANDSVAKKLEVTCNNYTYAENIPFTSGVGFNEGSGILLMKLHLNEGQRARVEGVKVYLAASASLIFKKVFGVVLDDAGNIIARSDTLEILNNHPGTFHTFYMNEPHYIEGGSTGKEYYVGVAQVAGGVGNGYFPVGSYSSNLVPPNIYYSTGIGGGVPTSSYTNLGIWSIEAVMASSGSPKPVSISGDAIICAGATNQTFTAPAAPTATSYQWSVPTGATITSGQSTTSVAVDFGTATEGSVMVQAQGACGLSDTTFFDIDIINPVADFHFNFSGNNYNFTNNSIDATSYLWDFGTGDTSNLPDPTYTFTQNGTFNVCLTARDGDCENQMCETVTITGVGIDDPADLKINIYPNPANQILNIELSEAADIKANLYNGLGQAVYKLNIKKGSNEIDISTLPAGIYHLELFNKEFNKSTKIIVNR